MQAWQRQPAQCMFCAFRRSNARNVSTSSAYKLEYRFKPRNTDSDHEDFRTRQPDESRSDRPVRAQRFADRVDRSRPDNGFVKRPFDKTRRDSGRASATNFDRNRIQAPLLNKDGKSLFRSASRTTDDVRSLTARDIEDALAKTQNAMRKYTPVGQEKTQMQLLDPEGTQWDLFQRQIVNLALRALSEKGIPDHLIEKKQLWTRLLTAYRRGRESLEKELSFSFMDSRLKIESTSNFSENPLLDLRFPTEWYSQARKTQRSIHLHVGPTNSGKTYNALKRLQEAANGFYAGPLRLLAHEVYSRFRANGIPCDLITGDDIRYDETTETKVYASTVEMVNCGRVADVAVIDEIQMLGHEDRGWAWTRAFLGVNAAEVHLCGEERVIPLIRELAASMGDTLQIHRYQRLNPLKCMTKSLRGNLKLLRKGDCIVAFSVMQIHQLKKQIELETGKRCAIVYGSLPPETRAKQAELFNDPDNDYDYLVASDAIGMGLNLSVKRIIFNSVTRWDGTKQVLLSIPQIKQIAGRAGRYRSAHQDNQKTSVTSPDIEASTPQEETVGWVTTLAEADLPIISKALSTEAPPLRRAGLMPPAEFLEEYNNKLPPGTPFEYLVRTVIRAAKTHPRFFICDTRDTLAAARLIEDVPNLTIEQRVNLCAAPIANKNPSISSSFKALARAVSKAKRVSVVDFPEIPLEVLANKPTASRQYLESLEDLHKCLILYLWLSYRFSTVLSDQPQAMHAKEITEEKINWTLRTFSANPALRQRLQKLQKQPASEGSIAAETIRYLEAMKQMEAEALREKAATEIEDHVEVPGGSETQTQGFVGEESFDEHFAEPSGFVSEQVEADLTADDEAETLEAESREQVSGTQPVSKVALEHEAGAEAETELESEKRSAVGGSG